jgi:iron(III) transport system ATP-binding protein
MTSVKLEHVSKQFGDFAALTDIDLSIAAGELFFLLGPSGCGKSTLLRLIAGLHAPSTGRVLFNDVDVTSKGTDQRDAVMVFQSYALWPHLTVRENIRFGLRVRKLSSSQQRERIDQMLNLVQLTKEADRRPSELSGGQQQRVALARAIAVSPKCLLLDEPLSNLDAKLRHEMRTEIRHICKSQGVTTIYVTHDQKEALSVADRIALLNGGKIAQIGSPADLYAKPVSAFVAEFVGETNLIDGTVTSRDNGMLRVTTAIGEIIADDRGLADTNVTLSLRPEHIRIARGQPAAANHLSGPVDETTFLGETSEHLLKVGGTKLKVVSFPPRFDSPKELTIEFDPKDVVVLPRRPKQS